MKRKKDSSEGRRAHVSTGSVFDDLDFSAEEAAALKLKSELHSEVLDVVRRRKLSAKQLEEILKQPQPRISELLCGKISKMSAEKLVGYLSLLEVPVDVSSKESRKKRSSRVLAQEKQTLPLLPASLQPQQVTFVFVTINSATEPSQNVGAPVARDIKRVGTSDNVISFLEYQNKRNGR
jgi:predicted XRE-type DNA-binding protein